MLKLNFVINLQRENNGIVPIYCSLACKKERPLLFSTGLKIAKTKWETAQQKAKGNGEEALIINRELMNMRLKLNDLYNNLTYNEKTVSNNLLKSLYYGETKLTRSFVDLIETSIKRSFQDATNGKIAPGTLNRHRVYHYHLMMFLTYKKVEDISLREIDYRFIKELENWGGSHEGVFYETVSTAFRTRFNSWHPSYKLEEREKVKNKWGTNYLAKHISLVKLLFEEAIKLGEARAQDNPFNSYEIEYDNNSVYKYLTTDELEVMEEATFDSDRLTRVRDCFVFACYTGLAHIDLTKLNSEWVSKNIKGTTVIKNNRQKSKTCFTIPVLEPALAILDRYKSDPQCLYTGKLLPVLSLTNYNLYLKEIGAILGITKILTTHVARHTAATLLLRYGVPAETVSKVLGVGLKVLLDVYGDIVQDKIIEDMNIVNERIKKIN